MIRELNSIHVGNPIFARFLVRVPCYICLSCKLVEVFAFIECRRHSIRSWGSASPTARASSEVSPIFPTPISPEVPPGYQSPGSLSTNTLDTKISNAQSLPPKPRFFLRTDPRRRLERSRAVFQYSAWRVGPHGLKIIPTIQIKGHVIYQATNSNRRCTRVVNSLFSILHDVRAKEDARYRVQHRGILRERS